MTHYQRIGSISIPIGIDKNAFRRAESIRRKLLVAAELNQMGASCLSSEDNIEQSIKCFQMALDIMTTIGCQQDIPEETVSFGLCLMQKLFAERYGNSNQRKGERQSVEQYIYTKPFFFNPEASEASLCVASEAAPYCGVILFNLALANHEQSKTSGEKSLRLAAKLYDECLIFLRSGGSFDCSNVVIAAMHNQARIYEDLCDFKTACIRYYWLAELLGMETIRKDTIEKEDLEKICLNISFFTFPTCAPIA